MSIISEIKKLIEMDENYVKFSFTYPIGEISTWLYNPLRLNIQVSKKCNQKCISCNSFNKSNEDELSIPEIMSCIKQTTSLFEIKNIAFTGGEVLLKNGIHDCFAFAKNLSENVSITTNGQLISSIEYAKQLIISGINNITVSYHGIGVHDKFTSTKNAERNIINAISYLSSAKLSLNMPLRIKIGTLITEWSCNTLKDMLDWCERNSLELFVELPDTQLPIFKNTKFNAICLKDVNIISDLTQRLFSWREQGKPLMLKDENIVFINKYLRNQKINSPCPIGFFDIYIDSTGNVYTGCWVLPPIGNIRTHDISEIIYSDIRLERLNQMLHRKCPGCSCGYMMMSKYYLPYVIESMRDHTITP